jgi:hypothetical protein
MVLSPALAWPLLAQSPMTEPPMTNGDVLELLRSKVPGDAIILIIRGGDVRFDTGEAALQRLRAGGASNTLIDAIRAAAKHSATNGAGPPRGQQVQPSKTALGSARAVATTNDTPNTTEVTNVTVIEMVRQGRSADSIVRAVKGARGARFDVRPSDLVVLKRGGVPDSVIEAMLEVELGRKPEANPLARKARGQGEPAQIR